MKQPDLNWVLILTNALDDREESINDDTLASIMEHN